MARFKTTATDDTEPEVLCTGCGRRLSSKATLMCARCRHVEYVERNEASA